jgi:hypothetical protein
MSAEDLEYRTIFRNAFEMAMQAKEMEEENESIVPMVLMGFEGMVIPAVIAGVGPGQLNEACKMAIKVTITEVKPKVEAAGETLGLLEWVAVVAEAYMQVYDKNEDETQEDFEARMNKRRDEPHVLLEPLFKDGDPSVKEAITITGFYPGGQYSITGTFRWTPVDGYEWDDPRETNDPGDDRWTYFAMVAQAGVE